MENFEKNIDLNQSNLNIIKKKISKNNIRDELSDYFYWNKVMIISLNCIGCHNNSFENHTCFPFPDSSKNIEGFVLDLKVNFSQIN